MKLRIFIGVLTVMLFGFELMAQERTFVISSGSEGGNYYKTGDLLADIFKKEFPKYNFRNIWSEGSVSNLENLDTKKADFALIQRNILLQNIFDLSSGTKNIEVLAPLYQERLNIYCNDSFKLDSSEGIADLIKSKEKFRVGITSIKSYSHKIFIDIANLLQLPLGSIEISENNYNQLIDDIESNKIDCIISFSLPIERLETNNEIEKIFFSKQEAMFLQSRIGNVNLIKIIDDRYTFGTFTFLVGTTNALELLESDSSSVINSIGNFVLKNNSFIPNNISNTLLKFEEEESQQLLNNLPINTKLAEKINYEIKEYKFQYLIALLILALLFLLFFRSNKLSLLVIRKYWHRYSHIVIGIILLVILYLFSVELMILFENNLFVNSGIKSQIINMSKRDLHFWVFISNMTQNDGGVFPVSDYGKLMYSLSFYTIWIGGICIAIAELIIKKSILKRQKGMKDVTDENHIVISGWNDGTLLFIKDFMEAKGKFVKKKGNLVIVVENTMELREKYPEELGMDKSKIIQLVAGDIRQLDTLKKANISKASTVVLFAEDKSTRADEKTLLRALSISKYCKSLNLAEKKIKNIKTKLAEGEIRVEVSEYLDSIYIIAEINDNKYEEDLRQADVNEVICSNLYSKNVITQSIFNHGVSKVLDELLTYNDLNEFYEIDLRDKANKKLVGKTFDELILPLRKQGIQLMAIHKLFYDINTDMQVIDQKEIKLLLEKIGLERELIVNPTSYAELKEKTDDDDALIVLCDSEVNLKKYIAKVKF